ncbi:MAG TPA: ABC transporter permease [Propionicimonas sp.]|jgi:ABC-type multidrug transport system permease subunit|nr:ABC transporter permease [Propionicimonas sp.]
MNGSLTRIGAVVVKEFKHLRRDPRTLAAVVLLPVIQLLLFAWAISFDVDQVPTVVVDFDHTQTSADYVRAYDASTFFSVVQHADSLAAVDGAFDANSARVAVIIPAGFERTITGGGRAQVAVLIDGSETNAAKVSQAYSVALNQLYDQNLTRAWADQQGLDLSGLGALQPQIRTWYNPDRNSTIFLVPGLMAVIIAIVTVQQTAVTLVRERALGTEEQLEVSPIRKGELMVGKLLPWTLIAFADVVMVILLGMTVFGVPMRGTPWVLALGSVLFVFASLGMGLVISALAPSAETANIIALLVAFLPSFLLSGLAFPLDQIPAILQGVSMAFPARYMVTVARGVFLKGTGFMELWPQLAALAGYAALMVIIAARLYGRRGRR